MAVIINDSNEVLMMQEAKSSCAGQWYLPAGRVEPNESISVSRPLPSPNIFFPLQILARPSNFMHFTSMLFVRSFSYDNEDSDLVDQGNQILLSPKPLTALAVALTRFIFLWRQN